MPNIKRAKKFILAKHIPSMKILKIVQRKHKCKEKKNSEFKKIEKRIQKLWGNIKWSNMSNSQEKRESRKKM